MSESRQPLTGISVLDLSTMVAGPFCCRLLAGFGASVIKVEQPGDGDPSRSIPPMIGDPGNGNSSALFSYLNAGKESITLDLTTAEGLELLWQLSQRADVVVESFGPSQRELLGLEYDLFRMANPRLVVVSISPFGQTGPDKDRKATELTLLAEGGYLRVCGDPEREPVKPYGYVAQYSAGLQAAVAAMGALRASQMTGEGDVVDVSIQESVGMLLANEPTWYNLFNQVYERCGSRVGCAAPRTSYSGNVLPCNDGHVFVSTGQNQEGLAFVSGDPLLASKELWQQAWSHGDEIDQRCSNWLQHMSRDGATKAAQEVQVAVTPLLTVEEVLESEHLRERGFFDKIDTGPRGHVTLPGPPFRMSRGDWKVSAPPLLDEHTSEVLKGLKGKETAQGRPRGTPNAGAAKPEMTLPLSGIRVVDLTQVVAGPTATLLLAALGAQVIKIERPFLAGLRQNIRIIPARVPGAPEEPWNRVPVFNELNRFKMSMSLNLNEEAARDILKQLIAASDIIIDNFSPRVMENFGLKYETVRRINPSIIAVSISGLGSSGPWRDWVAAGPSIDATSGWAHLTGYEGGGPLRPANYSADIIAGFTGALAAILAILHRDRTGEGQYVDVSMLESVLQFLGEAFVATSAGVELSGRRGNRSLTSVPSGCYPCRKPDSWIALTITSDAEWQILCEVMDRDNLAGDPMYATESMRQKHHAKLDELIGQWSSSQSATELCKLLARKGLSVGVVKSSRDLVADAHFRAREVFQLVSESQAGPVLYSRFGWLFSRLPNYWEVPAPGYGEHNRFVLREVLGLPEQKIEELKGKGVIRDAPQMPWTL